MWTEGFLVASNAFYVLRLTSTLFEMSHLSMFFFPPINNKHKLESETCFTFIYTVLSVLGTQKNLTRLRRGPEQLL